MNLFSNLIKIKLYIYRVDAIQNYIICISDINLSSFHKYLKNLLSYKICSNHSEIIKVILKNLIFLELIHGS